MDNSILIGKLIYKLLSQDETLSGMVDQKIYPLVANADTTYPFVVYSRTSLNVEYCKDGIVEDQVEFQVVAVSDNYVESLEVANQIRNILELKRCKEEEMNVTECRIDSVSEEYNEDAYIQRITFTLKIN